MLSPAASWAPGLSRKSVSSLHPAAANLHLCRPSHRAQSQPGPSRGSRNVPHPEQTRYTKEAAALILLIPPWDRSKSTALSWPSVQFSHSVVSNSLQPHEPQQARPPCPSPKSQSSPVMPKSRNLPMTTREPVSDAKAREFLLPSSSWGSHHYRHSG